MKGALIPGYRDLYGEPMISYEELLKNTSSDSVIMLLIGLNAELNTEETYSENQKRLFEAVTLRFASEQILNLKEVIQKYKILAHGYDGTLFSRRYLLSMLLKELQRNNGHSNDEDAQFHEYNFFQAYLLVIDEVHSDDQNVLDSVKNYDLQTMPGMPLLWATNINQYEFNDMARPDFEIFKLLSFFKHSYLNYKPFLKELVNKYGFKNISQLMASLNQIVKATLIYRPDEFLRKLYFLVPKEGIQNNHLDSLCINSNDNECEFSMASLRKFPLYKTQKRGYMVVDESMYTKKIYRGPLFELQKETGLSEEVVFDDYKTELSKKCFEDVLFKGIVSRLAQKESSIIHFDSSSNEAEPDLYYREGSDVFLVEFKDYLFPDNIIKGKSFGAYRKYVEERFLLSSKGKKKGVSQLTNCINNLLDQKYDFDILLNEKIKKGEKVNIHPIICHTDFMFGMPGLNEYLNKLFAKKLKETKCSYSGINSIALLNLDVLFDLALRGGSFMRLLEFINRYFNQMEYFRKTASFSVNSDIFLRSTASFDELYQTQFRNEMIDQGELTNKDRIKQITAIIDITQEQIDEIL
jgi:hypothetical protein